MYSPYTWALISVIVMAGALWVSRRVTALIDPPD